MNLEDLTKTQIVLLAVMVSFVTSIATGIAAASLLNEVPGTVGQTVHKVVERTVEKVVPSENGNMAAAGGTTKVKETTVVVKESDMIMDSINKNTANLVRLYNVRNTEGDVMEENATSTAKDATSRDFLSLGTIVSENGLVVVPFNTLVKNGNYEVEFYDGKKFSVQYTGVKKDGLALFTIQSKEPKTFSFSKTQAPGMLKIGSSVITLSGKERDAVAVGIISKFEYKEVNVNLPEEEPKTKEVVSSVHTDIDSLEVLPGSPLITLFNEVAGVAAPSGINERLAEYVPAFVVRQMVEEYRNNKNAEETKSEEGEAETKKVNEEPKSLEI